MHCAVGVLTAREIAPDCPFCCMRSSYNLVNAIIQGKYYQGPIRWRVCFSKTMFSLEKSYHPRKYHLLQYISGTLHLFRF